MNRKNILMATMGMNIGGAETHIVELCKELVRRGHKITVASNGGVYVPELTAAGVTHVAIPMHRRNPKDMVKSYFALRRLIRAERFDLVHAHARIPSFLCGLLHKRMGFPFVTTAHFNFTTGGLAGKLTNWGEQTIAVSDDIKAYLIENYGLPEGRIFTTVNGIDMDRFSRSVSGDAIRAEFGIPADAPVVLHVSRLDEGPGIVAEQLIRIARDLAVQIPEIQLLIVGGGNQLEQFRTKAEAVNGALGRTVIHMAGPRTDINACIAASDVFCGVSRAALEAMSAEKPVVLAGHQGYVGIFNESKLDVSRRTNFCYRGCDPPTGEALLQDLAACFAIAPDQRADLGRYGRETVGRYYSVATMADDTLRAYEAVLNRSKALLLSGYYGFQNAGDDAILDAFMKSAEDLPCPVQITVLSNTPEQTAQKYGCDTAHRFGVFAVLRALRRCDVLVSGGGSLLQDKSSTRSIIYYLSIVRLAKLFGKPVMLYANGIGPVNRPANRRRVKAVVSRADMITLREESSRDELLRMGITAPEIHVTADPIFILDSIGEACAAQVLRDADVTGTRPLVGISVRNLRLGPGFVKQMARLGDRLTQELGYDVVFIPMQMPSDWAISREIMEQMEHPAYILEETLTAEALIGASGKMDLVITMRLHTMLFAAKSRVPVIGLVCDPKIEYFLEKLALPSGGPVEDFDPDRVFEQAKEVLDMLPAYRADLEHRVSDMEAQAAENGRYLGELLKRMW